MKWWVVAVLALAAGVVGLLIGLGVNSGSTGVSVGRLNSSQLQDEKLRQEIKQLQISNAQDSSPLHSALAWAPFVTALGAIAAVGATLWKQTSDLAAARTQLHDDHEKTRVANEQWQQNFLEDQRSSRQQQEQESLRRFDTNLSMVITNLGAASETLQVNAAAALATYIKPRYAEFHCDLLLVVAANLRLRPSAAVTRALRSDLERLLRLVFGDPEAYGDDLPRDLDLSRASLERLDVSAVDFRGVVVDVAFADMSEARLAGAKLFRMRGREVHLERAYCSRAVLGEARLDGAYCGNVVLHNANLVSASLKHADLRGAQFQEASMQEAHLEGANLEGADFTKANLANTYFGGAQFDEEALHSIARGALRWRDNKNFDVATKQALERYAPAKA
jgi:uncharacterized protein YjbI with pentapeptide repeats